MSSNRPVLLKIVLIGDSGVGKTSLLWSLCERKCGENELIQPTIGVDFLTHKTTVRLSNGKSRDASLQIWDTSGSERFRSVAAPFYRGADGVVFVFDVTNRGSLNALSFWIAKMREFFADGELPAAVLVGNKTDAAPVARVVTAAEAQAFAQANGLARYLETAAAARDSVVAAFDALTAEIRVKESSTFEPTPVMMLSAYNGRHARVNVESDSRSTCCSK